MLEIIASDPGLQQAELVFLGLYGRALRLLGPGVWTMWGGLGRVCQQSGGAGEVDQCGNVKSLVPVTSTKPCLRRTFELHRFTPATLP